MTKVVKLALISNVTDKDGNKVEYNELNRCLWELQKETRDLKNAVVRECWEWYGFTNDYYKLNEEYPNERDYLKKAKSDGTIKDYALDGFIYAKYSKKYNLHSGNYSQTLRDACGSFKNNLKEILRGDKSILSYRADQPLDIKKTCIGLEYDKDTNTYYVTLVLLNKNGVKHYNISDFRFKITVKDNSTRTILERCFDGVYGISASKLIWNRKKSQWFLNLCYSFDKVEVKELDKKKILGVNLGVYYPLYASISGEKDRLAISGDEIIEFRKRIEARRTALKKQAAVCGDGRIGHGYKTRMKPLQNVSDKIANFRDTFNHKASKKLIDFAIKKDCGIIQLENLKGVTKNSEGFLKNWSFYDLQSKIENKAKERGIKVVYIEPAYTSLRCSKCGCIHKDNHPTREQFICQECGYRVLHDYNASQNIAVKDIDKIIKAELEKTEPEKKTEEEKPEK